jgi:hypothetical protein
VVWALRLHGEPGGSTSITGTARFVLAIYSITITPLSGHTSGRRIEADQTTPAFDAYVREHGFDLVVVGRHGVDRAVHPRIGGVSEHQVLRGSCPVMVVGSS